MRNDTIAAIATAPGNGGISIIRISGPEAENILCRVFKPAGGITQTPFESHRMLYGRLTDGSETIDECMAVLMRAPKSYTREDVAEIHLHGGDFVVRCGLELLLREGARLAEAGEFTRRAFLNGRIDLSQAEAVMDLISAQGEQAHRAAIRQMDGGAASFIRPLSDRLYELQAGLAACIDYPEEISDEEGAGMLRQGLEELIHKLDESIDEHTSRLLHRGLQTAIIGRPNVGKSSLLNALLEEERAIVTSVPGTTRDTIRGEMILNGIRIELTDTAGIRETEDPVERIGVERSESAWKNADLTILVLDGSSKLTKEDSRLLKGLTGNAVIVINKADLPQVLSADDIRDIQPAAKQITISAKKPEMLQPLKDELKRQASVSDQTALTQPRQLDAAKRAAAHLKDALGTVENYTPDMAATDLQAAQEALSEITGDKADEKLLDRIFSQFCVGK
jgi:tRNA modification GTPase